MSKITVIVPNYNKSQYIEECIQSIKDQTFNDFECIIVDDGSIDNSKEIINKLIENDNRFQLFCNTNHGLSFSRNFGIKNANTEFVLPLDSDDYIEKDYVKRIIEHFNQHPETTLFYGKWFFIGYNADYMNFKLGNLHYIDYKTLLRGNSIHCCCAYRKKNAIDCGLFDENMQGYEDWEFLIRLLYKDKIVAYDPHISLYYRQLQNNMSSDCHQTYFQKFNYIVEKNKKIYNEVLSW